MTYARYEYILTQLIYHRFKSKTISIFIEKYAENLKGEIDTWWIRALEETFTSGNGKISKLLCAKHGTHPFTKFECSVIWKLICKNTRPKMCRKLHFWYANKLQRCS